MRSNAKAVIANIKKRLDDAMRDAPKILANVGQQHFNKNFAAQSDEGERWPNVKRRESGTFEYKYPKKKYLARRTNPILVGKTRRLKNAVNRSIKSATRNRIVWGVYGAPGVYGYYHNYGIGQNKRTFMRMSKQLRVELTAKYRQVLRRAIKA